MSKAEYRGQSLDAAIRAESAGTLFVDLPAVAIQNIVKMSEQAERNRLACRLRQTSRSLHEAAGIECGRVFRTCNETSYETKNYITCLCRDALKDSHRFGRIEIRLAIENVAPFVQSTDGKCMCNYYDVTVHICAFKTVEALCVAIRKLKAGCRRIRISLGSSSVMHSVSPFAVGASNTGAELIDVVEIMRGAYKSYEGPCPDLSRLKNLTTIGAGAFYGAMGQPDLSGLENLTTIGDDAFASADGVPNLSGLKKLTTIGNGAFQTAEGAPDLSGLKKLTTIGNCAFYSAEGMPDLSGLENLTEIGEFAFVEAEVLPDLSGSVNLTAIGTGAFRNANGHPNLSGLKNLTTIGTGAFTNATGVPDLSGLKNLTTIGDRAFWTATGVPDLSGLANLATIGKEAFMNATGVPDLSGLENLTTIGDRAFRNAKGVPDLSGLENLTTIGKEAFGAHPVSLPSPHTHVSSTLLALVHLIEEVGPSG